MSKGGDWATFKKANESYFNSLDSKCSGYVVIDLSNQKYLFVSDMLQNVTGYSAEQMLTEGMGFWASKIYPDDLQKVMEAGRQWYTKLMDLPLEERTKPYGSFCYRITKSDGSLIWSLQSSQIILLDKSGNPSVELGYLTDITLYKKDNKVNGIINYNGTVTYIDSDKFSPKKKIFTTKEIEVLKLIDKGLSSKDIAMQLNKSKETVDKQRHSIIKKIDAKNIVEALQKAKLEGVL
ncbi:MAG: LuxR C-terminal-related transcriptional regulator [Bacteroidota bacterium]|nr:LuxR C-terminal-related transcriptional regulator [Bacteroidota bacterium]